MVLSLIILLSSLYIHSVSEQECIQVISQLKITKTHLDEIPVKLFVKICDQLAYPLSKLINLSFHTINSTILIWLKYDIPYFNFKKIKNVKINF